MRTYNISIAILSAALLVAVHSCSRDSEEVYPSGGRSPMLLSLTPDHAQQADQSVEPSRGLIADDATTFSDGAKVKMALSWHKQVNGTRNYMFRNNVFGKLAPGDEYYDAQYQYFGLESSSQLFYINGIFYDFYVVYPHDVADVSDGKIRVDTDAAGAWLSAGGATRATDNDLMSNSLLNYYIDAEQSVSRPSVALKHRLSKIYFSIIKNEEVSDAVTLKGIAFNTGITERTWDYYSQSWVEAAAQTTVPITAATPAERYAQRNVRLDFSTSPLAVLPTGSDNYFAEALLIPDSRVSDIVVWLEVTPQGGSTVTKYMNVTIDMNRTITTGEGKITRVNLGYNTQSVVYILNVYSKKWEEHPVSGSGNLGGAVDDQNDM